MSEPEGRVWSVDCVLKPSYHFRNSAPPAASPYPDRGSKNLGGCSSVKPTVLIATTTRWIPTARLAVALANAGFIVDAVCPSEHPITNTEATRKTYKYKGLDPLTSFEDAISTSKPDLIVPGDDRATQHLHLLYDQACGKGETGKPICALIERSLGASENFPALYARTKF